MNATMKWSLRSLVAVVIPAIVGMSCIEATGTSPRLTEPRILFVSTRDGNEEIYAMNSDGTGVVRLTNDPARDTRPVWSPDGTLIAFVSERTGNRDIWVMNADGTGLRNLTADPSTDDNPAWAPDQSRIVFSSTRIGGQAELFVMNPDGTSPRPTEQCPRCPVQLTDHFATDTWPAYSPDARFIAFQANRNSINEDIYVLFNTTNEVTRMTTAGGADIAPVWSPDGTKIAFASFRDGNFEIYTMDFTFFPVRGPNQVNLTNNAAADGRPSWSFNARQICFVSNRAGNSDIWLMNADGSNPVRLTTYEGLDDFCSIK